MLIQQLKVQNSSRFRLLYFDKENRDSDSRIFLTLLRSHFRAGDFSNAGVKTCNTIPLNFRGVPEFIEKNLTN